MLAIAVATAIEVDVATEEVVTAVVAAATVATAAAAAAAEVAVKHAEPLAHQVILTAH